MTTKQAFEAFGARVDAGELAIEGITVLDASGRELYGRRWAPDKARNIYSHTKGFLAAAVGVAVGDGLITPDITLGDCFPAELEAAGGEAGGISLRNLLTMSSGFGRPLLMGKMRREAMGYPDYLAFMLSQPLALEPGSAFCYSSGDSYLAGRMLEAATGTLLQRYVYERVLRPLGIGWPVWECCPQGHALGGASMHLRLADQAKLGLLYLNEGVWEGGRIVPAEWVCACSTVQIATTGHAAPGSGSVTVDDAWYCRGFGYQLWMNGFAGAPGAYRTDGSFGQNTIVLPSHGLVISLQCPEEGDFGKVRAALQEVVDSLS